MSIDHFSSATDMLSALQARQVSSRELVDMQIERIERFDGKLNSIPVQTFDRARENAAAADKRLASGEKAALLGLPMTLKESSLTAGLPQTAGIEAFKGYLPEHDGRIASEIFEAGACLLGKTNIPVALADWQADSPVYGRTNNPWDVSRTPGGSTGGGGAALAAGLTPLEVGSDIGGSIRVPAAFCGVYGHRPSETAIPRSGCFPMADLPNPAFLMGVQGPLARSAVDLELLFDVIAGPEPGEDVAWQLHLPPARHERLADFRVAVLPSVLGVNPASQVHARLEELVGLLAREGASVSEALPEVDMQSYYEDYLRMLTVMTSQGEALDARRVQAAGIRARGGNPAEIARNNAQAEGFEMGAQEYLLMVARRESARVAWQRFFTAYDVVIAPMCLDAAFPHQDEPGMANRELIVDNEAVPYINNILFPMVAIFPGLPSTAFPAGLNSDGLPIGLQAIGPNLEDRTTLRFAQLLEQAWHRFTPPKGY